MLIQGDINQEYQPSAVDLALSDGRVIGPFESKQARTLFGELFGDKTDRLFSARELFEGAVVGDEYRLIHTDEFSLETYPYSSIHDIWLGHDNGQVVFELSLSSAAVDPRRLVLVDLPVRMQPKNKLPEPVAASALFDLSPNISVCHSMKSTDHGEIVVCETYDRGDANFTIGWRRDGRQTRDIVGLSRHSFLELAIKKANELSLAFAPRDQKRTNRPADGQRERLYTWEHSFTSAYQRLPDIGEASALAVRICDDLNLNRIELSLGRSNLQRSYYKGGRYMVGNIVIGPTMLDNHTVVHEVAHYVVDRLKLPKEVAHGPIFVGTLLALMKEYMEVDIDEALEKAKTHKVTVNLDAMEKVSKMIKPAADMQETCSPSR